MKSSYIPRHYAGLLAGVSRRERDRLDHERAQAALTAVDTSEALLLSVILSADRAAKVAAERQAA